MAHIKMSFEFIADGHLTFTVIDFLWLERSDDAFVETQLYVRLFDTRFDGVKHKRENKQHPLVQSNLSILDAAHRCNKTTLANGCVADEYLVDLFRIVEFFFGKLIGLEDEIKIFLHIRVYQAYDKRYLSAGVTL